MGSLSEYKTVNISHILNYAENPRHDIGNNEIDTIKKLINKVGTQYIYNLAKDIYENGLLGSNLPVLVFEPKQEKYVVYEGNRRVACLKFLNNPDILTTVDKALKQRIENLIKTETPGYSTEIYCYITNEEEALLIMERTHSGEDKGRGLKAWSPKEKDVFQKRLKLKNSIELVIAELTEKFLKKDITQKIKYTNLQRFFNNREVKKALNIDVEDISNNSKREIILINDLVDKAIEESEKKDVSLSRLFNKARDIEDFFLPLIEEYRNDSKNEDKEPPIVKNEDSDILQQIKPEDTRITKGNNDSNKEPDENNSITDNNLKLKIDKDENIPSYFSNQTIDLKERIELINEEKYDPHLLVIESKGLNIANGIIQPNNLPGEYIVTYKYFMDNTRELVYWQDSLLISIKQKKTPYVVPKQVTVLSQSFLERYHDKLDFQHSEKIKALINFLSNENKNGKYSYFINIVSRMFLEYTFRLYASKVLKEDNLSIDTKSKSLQSFIDYCCIKIEQENPKVFVKHIQRGRKDATNKVDILQKSVHYFDVTISNDDIEVMFKNLNIYLELVYEKIIEEEMKPVEMV